MEQRKTLCSRDCPDTCGIVATVEDGRVLKLAGDPDHPITRGFLCHRTNQYLRRQYSPARLTSPLLRKDGALTEVSWDEALDVAANALLRVRAEYGPAAIFHYRSGGSLGLLKLLPDYFFELFGPVTIKRGDICNGAGEAAQELDFGVSDSSDPSLLVEARQILLWGKNLHTSSPHLIPIVQEAKARGAEVVLIDPVAHAGTRLADRYHQPSPGGDLALALGVARALFERGWVDADARSYCDHWDAFEALTRQKTLAEWCREADLGVEVAFELAERLRNGPCAIVAGWGMARRSNGGSIVRALDALGAISGNLGIAGGGVHYGFPRRRPFDTSFVKGLAVAPRSVPEPFFARDLRALRDPPIRALWVTAANPVAMLPDSRASAEAMRGLALSVVVDQFLTDTALHASLVLPAKTMLEEDDVLGSYGQPYVGVSRAVARAPEGVRSDLEIVQALAERVGLGKELAGTARDWQERLLRPTGISRESERVALSPQAARVLFADRRFPTPTGRVNLITALPGAGAPEDAAFPLRLLALSTPKSQSSQWIHEAPVILEATVHPAATPLADGSYALLESRIGSVKVVIKHDAAQRRNVVIVPKGGHLMREACANALLDAALTDLGEGGALYEQPVRVVALA